MASSTLKQMVPFVKLPCSDAPLTPQGLRSRQATTPQGLPTFI